jgi:SGNH hydrolase-like domain, acetyltransferase AlgX
MNKRSSVVDGARRRSVWRALRIVALQLLIAAILFEVVLRVVGPRTGIRRLLYQPAAATYYEEARTVEQLLDMSMLGFVPLTESYGYVLNSRSLRTTEYGEEKADGDYRVLAFGDSFTWASGALPHEQHWTTILDDRLGHVLDPHVELLRLGVPATGPDFQYRLWQIEGSRLEPDLVIQAFFVGNDFVDHRGTKATKGLRKNHRRELVADHWLSFRVARNLVRMSRGVVRNQGTIAVGAKYDQGGFPIPEYSLHFEADRPTFVHDKFIEIETERMAVCLDENEAKFEVLLDRVGATLAAFHSEVENLGARFVVMIIPDEYRVDARLAAEIALTEGRSLSDYDLDRPARRLGEYLSEHGIDYLDVTPEFVEIGESQTLYRIRDTHWNHNGNLLAGELLAASLTGGSFEGFSPVDPALISIHDWEDGKLD